MEIRYQLNEEAQLTEEQIREALTAAGFTRVVADHNDSHPWLTVIAEK